MAFAAAALAFIFIIEFAKAADQYIFAVYQRALDDLDQVFDNLHASIFGKTVLLGDHLDNLSLGQRHWRPAISR